MRWRRPIKMWILGKHNRTKTSNCVRARGKFWMNAMETAHQNVDSGEAKSNQHKQLYAIVCARGANFGRMPWRPPIKMWILGKQNGGGGASKRGQRGHAHTDPMQKWRRRSGGWQARVVCFPRTPCSGGGAAGPQKGDPMTQGPKSEGGGAVREVRMGYGHSAAMTQAIGLDSFTPSSPPPFQEKLGKPAC